MSNLVTQIVSVIILALSASGLNVTATDFSQIIEFVENGKWLALGLFLVNIGKSVTSWVKTWRETPTLLLQFLRSTNWWTSFANMVVAIITGFGVIIPDEVTQAVPDVISYALSGQWSLLITAIVANITNILIHRFVKKPEQAPNTQAKIGKMNGQEFQ
jgi:ABC-type uncharacterized transport system permease subunit